MRLIILLLILPAILFADKVVVNVKGLVCPTCAIGIKKYLHNTKKVKDVKLNINKQQVEMIELTDKKITNKEIIQAIHHAGYKIADNNIIRTTNE